MWILHGTFAFPYYCNDNNIIIKHKCISLGVHDNINEFFKFYLKTSVIYVYITYVTKNI